MKCLLIALCVVAASAQRRGRQEEQAEDKRNKLHMGMLPSILMQQMMPERIPLLLLLLTSLECLEKTTQSLLRFLNLDLVVKDKLMEVTMLTQRPSAKHSTSAQLMEPEDWLSTVSFVPMVPSSTRTTSSVTGGSTLTALLLNMLLLMRLLQFMNHLKVDLLVDLEAGGTTDVEEELELDLVKLKGPKFGHLMNKNCM